MDKKLKTKLSKIDTTLHESKYIPLYDIQSISVDDFISKIQTEANGLIDPVVVFDSDIYENGYTSLCIQGHRNKTDGEIEQERQLIITRHNNEKDRIKNLKKRKEDEEIKLLAKLKKKYEK
jgi:hypothetical protein